MYQSNMNVNAIRTIDKIVQTSKVNEHSTLSAQTYSSNHAFQSENSLSKLTMAEMIEEASEALEVVNTELEFRVHEGTGRPIIQLIEVSSKEVVREIPPEKMLDIVAGIWEWAGLFVDRKE